MKSVGGLGHLNPRLACQLHPIENNKNRALSDPQTVGFLELKKCKVHSRK